MQIFLTRFPQVELNPDRIDSPKHDNDCIDHLKGSVAKYIFNKYSFFFFFYKRKMKLLSSLAQTLDAIWQLSVAPVTSRPLRQKQGILSIRITT